MGLRNTAVAAALTGAFLVVAPATAFEDPATGFAITVPPPYQVEPMNGPPRQVQLAIPPVEGGPSPALGMPQLCAVTFETEPSGPQYATQAEIDAAMAQPTYLAEVGINEALLDSAELALFSLNGASGVEFQGPMAGDPGVRFYFALARVPAGQATLTCVTSADELEAGLAVFRQLRDAMVLPHG